MYANTYGNKHLNTEDADYKLLVKYINSIAKGADLNPVPQTDFVPEERFSSELRAVRFTNPEFEDRNWDEINRIRGLGAVLDHREVKSLSWMDEHQHSNPLDSENCVICKAKNMLTKESTPVFELMAILKEKLQNKQVVASREARDIISSVVGHGLNCKCDGCFNLRQALICVGRMDQVLEKLGNGERVNTDEINVIINLAKYLKNTLLEMPLIEEDSSPSSDFVQGSSNSPQITEIQDNSDNLPLPGSYRDSDSESLRSTKSKKFVNRIKSILHKPRSYSTLARRNFSLNSEQYETYIHTQSFYSDNFNNFDFPHKYLIKFFDFVRGLNNHNFENEETKAIAMDSCILLNIKVVSVNKQKSKSFTQFKYNNLPVYLDGDKNIINIILFISNLIITKTKRIDYKTFGFEVKFIFEYKFITTEEYDKIIK